MARIVRPTGFDLLIGRVAPRWALRRLLARQAMATAGWGGQGGYEGARRTRRAGQNWKPGGGSANADLLPDLAELRERSRDLGRNAMLARGALNTVVTSVVGSGLKLRPQPDRTALGLSDAAAEQWEDAAEREWLLWSDSAEADLTRTQSFAEMQDLAFRSTLESGDVFVAFRFVDRPGSPYGLKLQVIEGDRVSNPGRIPDKRELVGGVELDGNGAPLAYHVTRTHPGDWRGGYALAWDRLPAFGERSGQRQVLHLFARLRPDQTRGEPYLAPVVEGLKQLARYSEAELMAAVVNACFAIVTKVEGQALSPVEQAAASTDSSGNPTRLGIEFDPGMVIEGLRQNESIDSFTAARPSDAFDPFVQAVLRQVGVALELPFEVLVKHFTASYSAARAALLEAWRFFRRRRVWLAHALCQPVYEAMLTEAVARGRLAAPGFLRDPAIRRAWAQAAWIGDAPGQIDPVKETDAAIKQIDAGLTTLADATASLNGGDWERNHRQRVRETAARKELAPATPAAPAMPATPATAPSDDDDEDEENAA